MSGFFGVKYILSVLPQNGFKKVSFRIFTQISDVHNRIDPGPLGFDLGSLHFLY